MESCYINVLDRIQIMITLFGSLETKENNKLDFFFYFIIIFIINYNNYKIIIIIIIIIFKDTSLYRQYKFERVQTYITCQLSHTLHWCHARGLKTSLQHIKDDFPCLTHTSWKIALFPSHMITGNNENSIKSRRQKKEYSKRALTVDLCKKHYAAF